VRNLLSQEGHSRELRAELLRHFTPNASGRRPLNAALIPSYRVWQPPEDLASCLHQSSWQLPNHFECAACLGDAGPAPAKYDFRWICSLSPDRGNEQGRRETPAPPVFLAAVWRNLELASINGNRVSSRLSRFVTENAHEKNSPHRALGCLGTLLHSASNRPCSECVCKPSSRLDFQNQKT